MGNLGYCHAVGSRLVSISSQACVRPTVNPARQQLTRLDGLGTLLELFDVPVRPNRTAGQEGRLRAGQPDREVGGELDYRTDVSTLSVHYSCNRKGRLVMIGDDGQGALRTFIHWESLGLGTALGEDVGFDHARVHGDCKDVRVLRR